MINLNKIICLICLIVTSQSSLFGQISTSIKGTIIDSSTEEPISFVYLHLEELNRTSVSTIDGEFELKSIPSGTYTLTVHRIGYRTQSRTIEITDEPVSIKIQLTVSILSTSAIEVIGETDELSGSGLEHASKKIFGSDLRRNLGTTLSETLSNLPGFDQRTMGASPGRPIIRGLGDERVVILQDGISSGDISSQSSDHAVTIDPVSASELEIARGPAALAYGANAIGGVINVVKNQIQTTLPSRLTGTYSINGQTVNSGASSALNLSAPIGDIALQLDINGKYGLNTSTPDGSIRNSNYLNTNDAIGLSYVQAWGYVGLASSIYFSNYGIPPDPNGHPNGVDIELRKYQLDGRSEILVNKDFLKVIEFDVSVKDYNHKEIEIRQNGDRGSIGSEFSQFTTNFDFRAKHNKLGVINSGIFGVSAEYVDYEVIGANTPPSSSFSLGGYLIEETDFGPLHVEGGIRFDVVQRTTSSRDLFFPNGVVVGSVDSTFYKNRSFGALSGSISGIYDAGLGFTLGATVLRSFRAPSLEELYSEGPHLASYSYEVGNPDLKPERAWAKEIFINHSTNSTSATLTLYHNSFQNYLFARNTGQASLVRPDLQDFQFIGNKATLYGVETATELKLTRFLVIDANASFTFGYQKTDTPTNGAEDQPLPQIPPFKLNTSLKYVNNAFEAGMRVKYAAEQNRTGEFETPTGSYTLTDTFFQYRLNSKKLLHTFALNINNVFNEEYRNHLSRIKELNLEPGRNISLLYRVYF